MINPAGATDGGTHAVAMRGIWDAAADGWLAHHGLIRSWLATATSVMLDAARIGDGQHVLDVAAGAGDQTLDIARRVGPHGHVLATDLSPRCIELARSALGEAGVTNAGFLVANGETLDMVNRFDAVVCRLGLMFHADPLQGLQRMHAALKPEGHCAVLVFSSADSNPCIVTAFETAAALAGAPPFDPDRPGGLLSLGRAGVLHDLFARAGFRDVTTARLSAPMRLPSAEHYIQFLKDAAGPIRMLIERLDTPLRATAWTQMEAAMSPFQTPVGWTGPNELLLVFGRRG
ncbi:MAG: class I SAM-dependent methyltransferase [Beijerinckiaceae bacterium]